MLSLLLLAVSQDSIFYGQIIRPYAMFQFFALLSSYLFVRSLREKRLVLWMAFVGSSILMMYTHLYGALVLAALVVPHKTVCFHGTSWFTGTRFSTLWTFSTMEFHLGGAGDGVAQRLDEEGTAINAILWSFPLFLSLGAGALGLPYNARYVLFCAAPYYILVAYGISVLENSALRHGLIMLIVAYSGYSIAEAFSQRTDGARRIMAHVESNVRTGDCGAFLWVVTSPPSWLAMWDSSSAAPLAPVPTARVDRLSFRLIPQTTLPAAFVPCLRIWVFKVPEPDLGPPAQEMKHLDEEAMRFVGPTHKKVEEFSDAGLSVSLYSANATRESRRQAL